MMTEMEQDHAGRIIDWAFRNFKGVEDLTQEQMIQLYWKEQGYEITNDSTIGALDIIDTSCC